MSTRGFLKIWIIFGDIDILVTLPLNWFGSSNKIYTRNFKCDFLRPDFFNTISTISPVLLDRFTKNFQRIFFIDLSRVWTSLIPNFIFTIFEKYEKIKKMLKKIIFDSNSRHFVIHTVQHHCRLIVFFFHFR